MKTLHYFMLMLIVATFSITTHSCSDSDNDDDWSLEVDDEASKQFFEEAKTNSILLSLCDVDSLDNGGVEYTPRIGRKLYDSKPTVYYTIANTLEEAEDAYQCIVAGLNTDSLGSFNQHEVQQGDIHLTFSESKESGETARLTIDCPRLSDVLTEIVFLTEEHWPQNDNSSPFQFGSLWRHREDDGSTRLYLCVRTCKSDKGILLTFDGGWELEHFNGTSEQSAFDLYKNGTTASKEAFEGLGRMMNYNSKMYEDMLERLKSTEEYKNGKSMFAQLYSLKDKNMWWGVFYITKKFENSHTSNHKKEWYHLFHKRTYWNISLNESKVLYRDGKFIVSYFCTEYGRKNQPYTLKPSHEILFDYDFFDNNKERNGWERIYKGT